MYYTSAFDFFIFYTESFFVFHFIRHSNIRMAENRTIWKQQQNYT